MLSKHKLIKANKSLHVLRTLRREGYNQAEIDYLFNSIALPNISYGLAVYGAAEAELTTIQRFLDRCKKRRYISYGIDIHDLLEKQDKNIRTKVMGLGGHPLYNMLPEVKNTSSIGNGGFDTFILELCSNRFCAHILCSHFYARILKLYVFPIESAFKYPHQLNRNESSNGFHILRSCFCAHILNSHIAWHSRKITVA